MDKPLTAEEEEFINQLEEEMKEGGGQKGVQIRLDQAILSCLPNYDALIFVEITTAELRKLISHGLVSSTFLDTLLDQYTSVDSDQLATNMKKVTVPSRFLSCMTITIYRIEQFNVARYITFICKHPIPPTRYLDRHGV